jgi:hypothetical protein
MTGTTSFEEAFDSLPTVDLPSRRAVSEGQTVSAFGYSSSKSWKGRNLGYCQGPLERDAGDADAYGLRCQLGGGASGGPWYSEPGGAGSIFSVSSYLLHGDNRVYGPVFDDDEEELYAQAEDGSCDPDEEAPCTTDAFLDPAEIPRPKSS